MLPRLMALPKENGWMTGLGPAKPTDQQNVNPDNNEHSNLIDNTNSSAAISPTIFSRCQLVNL